MIHVLGDALSRAPRAKGDLSLNDVEVLFIHRDDVIVSYGDDQFFEPILKAMKEQWRTEENRRKNWKAYSDACNGW